MNFKELVSAYRATRGLTKTDIAAGLNQYLPVEEQMVPMAVTHWERGTWKPRATLLHWVWTYAPDGSWQHSFAEDGLKIRGIDTDKLTRL